MKIMFILWVGLITTWVQASEPTRVMFQSQDNSITLEGFEYLPQDLANAKGVILLIGGSGYTKGGFGGPSKFSRTVSDQGYVAFEWNKRGLTTNKDFSDIQKNSDIYNTATVDNIFSDAQAALYLMKQKHPHLPLFVVGGSEGSIITTLLAQHHPNDVVAASVFGTVVAPFVEIVEKQMADQLVHNHWEKFDLDKNNLLSKEEYLAIAKDDKNWSLVATFGFENINIVLDDHLTKSEVTKKILDHYLNEGPDRNDHWMKTSGIPPNYFASIFAIPSLYIRAAEIKVPVLIMHGEEDWNTPVEDVFQFQVVCDTNGFENFDFKYYSGVGHAPSPEMLTDFLAYFEIL